MREMLGRRQSLRGEAHVILHGLARRWNLPWLERHHNRLHVLAFFAFLSGAISIALMTALAMLTRTPFIFPSLGSTAFLIFYAPRSVSASPRSAILGHLIAIAAAYFALLVTGLLHSGSALTAPLTWPRTFAVTLALSLSAGAMIWTRAPHPPAASTALLIALGIVIDPRQVVIMYGGVALLVLQAIVINRLAGIPYPLWNASSDTR
jgi:CBS domain-containing membrane protein